MPPEALGLTIFFGLGFFITVIVVARLIARHEQMKLMHTRETEAAEHDERLAMIERGMPPKLDIPTAKGNREQTTIYSLTSVAVSACVFAWLSGAGWAAWLATGAIGVTCIIACLRIYTGPTK